MTACRRLTLIVTCTIVTSGALWGIAKWTFEDPRIAPYEKANMGSCPIPVGDRRGFWILGKRKGEEPFIGLDRRMRYRDTANQMHSGDIDQVMAVFSAANGFWGLKCDRDLGGAVVLVVVPNLPAAKAGLQPGDIITAVESEPTTGKTKTQLAALLRSQPGKRLTVMRGNSRFGCVVGPAESVAMAD